MRQNGKGFSEWAGSIPDFGALFFFLPSVGLCVCVFFFALFLEPQVSYLPLSTARCHFLLPCPQCWCSLHSRLLGWRSFSLFWGDSSIGFANRKIKYHKGKMSSFNSGLICVSQGTWSLSSSVVREYVRNSFLFPSRGLAQLVEEVRRRLHLRSKRKTSKQKLHLPSRTKRFITRILTDRV